MNIDNEFTAKRLSRVFESLSLTAPSTLFAELRTRYSDNSRAYYNVGHIEHCLQELDKCPILPGNVNELELAIWFHDAVYDTRASDNELRSADLAEQSLRACNATTNTISQVRSLILATTHDLPGITVDQQIMCDVDLSMLGVPPAVYMRLEAAIRHEYAWVPWHEFAQGRARILRHLLDRQAIYATPWFAEHYEVPARQNLAEAIARLSNAE